MPDRAAIILRAATETDAPWIAAIWYEGWRDGHEGHVPDELVAARGADSFRSRAQQRVGDTVVATIDGVIGGFIMVVGDEVEQVYVGREHRGAGVASVLLAEAERIVAGNGYDQAWLAVVAGNARARRFYERGGWVDDGVIDYPAAGENGPVVIQAQRYVKPVTRG
jgi:GNAT superfamily N-acetyltransferase